MYGRLQWVGLVVVGRECGWKGSRRGVLCGHGWCVWVGGGRRKEGGRGERATDRIEPQNSLVQEHLLLGTPMLDFGRGILRM